jgi:sulfoxide reductase heme-binding subunit YedZ
MRKARNPISNDLRCDIGIWAGIIGTLHAIVGQCVHLRGRPWLYYVYEHRQAHSVRLRHDLFGYASYTGLLGALLLLILLATSNDRWLRLLGTPKWKSLQTWNYACFGLVALHTALYQSSEKLHGSFVVAFAVGVAIAAVFQLIGFGIRINTVSRALVG